MSHFFAYLSRMKFIRRWGLMPAVHAENVQEHSLRVAQIAHALAIVRNRLYGGRVSPERTATLALYHDASEVLTGDLPTPVKNFNPDIRAAYRGIEQAARERLLAMVPEPLQADLAAGFRHQPADAEHWQLIEAADKLCAYIKCVEEVSAGNLEFRQAERTIRQTLDALELPEVRYFMETFVPSLRLTLDELG